MQRNSIKILFVLITVFLSSCLEESVDPLELRYSNSSDLITYVETQTNFFNGEDKPLLVTVDELNQNISSYLVLDIREQFDYELGHVPGAVSVKIEDLLNYLKEINTLIYQKIVLISSTGQLASYASSLLYIAGFENVYPLDRGMTYWNQIFSDELNYARDNAVRFLRSQVSVKPSLNHHPPDIFYQKNPRTIEEKIDERVNLLLSESPFNIFISVEVFDALYFPRARSYVNSFVIYSIPDTILHLPVPYPGVAPRIIYGPQSVTEYDMPWDFETDNFLFTLPADKNLILYSPNGQRSAFYTAYLKLLGYSSVTIKYGNISMMDKAFADIEYIYDYKTGEVIDTIYNPTYLTPYGFQEDKIRNYSYDAGPNLE